MFPLYLAFCMGGGGGGGGGLYLDVIHAPLSLNCVQQKSTPSPGGRGRLDHTLFSGLAQVL